MAKVDDVRAMVGPLAASAGADIYDVTLSGGKLVVALTRQDGIDLETLSVVSRNLGAQLDDTDLIGGSYTLEVTSPGLERPLRTAEHFAGAVGETVTIRITGGADEPRRVRGELVSAGETECQVVIDEADGVNRIGDEVQVSYEDIERARTVFTWGSPPANKPKSFPKSKSSPTKGRK